WVHGQGHRTQALAAGVGHLGTGLRRVPAPRRRRPARGARYARTAVRPERGSVRHRVGGDGRRAYLLPDRARLLEVARAVRPAHHRDRGLRVSPFRGSAQFTKDWQHFRFEVDEDHVGTITFIRPEKLNALTLEVYADLRDILAELPQRDDVRALIIIGTGRGFCSGGDVHEIIGKLLEMGTKDLRDFTRMAGTVIQRMRESPTPIIAAVNGVAAGAGPVRPLAPEFRVLAASGVVSCLFTEV